MNDCYSTPGTTCSDSVHPDAVAKPINRQHLQNEFAELRELASALEKHLEDLKARSRPVRDDCVWQGIAERQKKLRVAAEVENTKLRSMVTAQRGLARRLEKTAKRGARQPV